MLNGTELTIAAHAWWIRATAGLFGARNGRVGQRAIAAQIGTGQGRLWDYEHGKLIPQMPTAVRWAAAVGCQLAITGRMGGRIQVITVARWSRLAGKNLAAIRAEMTFMDGPYAGRQLAQRTLADSTGLAMATVQRIESGGAALATSWAAYVYGIGWEPVLLGRDGARACHTR